jgi:hypothetical protein
MNKEHLKELVKQHFGLVDKTPAITEEKFGEVFDENKAFKIVFPGDKLKVGDEVKVVTTDGQESLAPDGEHRLEDGTTIVTEGSSVVEIKSSKGKSEEEMAEDMNPGLAAKDEEVKAAEKVGFAGPKEDISNVEGTTPQNSTTVTDASVSELTGPVDTEAKEELAKMKEEMKSMKEEMKSMKAKFEEMAKSPASTKVTMSADANKETFSSENLQSKQMKVMAELLKNKNK